MFRPDGGPWPANLPTIAPMRPAPVAPPAGAPSQAQFDSVMRGMRREIESFIQQGSADGGFTVSGQMLRMRQMQTPPRPDRGADDARPAVTTARVPNGAGARSETATIGGRGERRQFDLRPLSAPLQHESSPPRSKMRTSAAAQGEHRPLSGRAPTSLGQLSTEQRQFLDMIRPHAREAARRLGVAPELVAAQAALESGWGQRPLRDRDGADTHNLFGIKAGSSWRGEIAEVLTTEFENGVAVKRTERFRSYSDLAEAFQDFTRLLLNAPRYRMALNTGNDAAAYAQALVKGGYATDPAYADKLVSVARGLQSR